MAPALPVPNDAHHTDLELRGDLAGGLDKNLVNIPAFFLFRIINGDPVSQAIRLFDLR